MSRGTSLFHSTFSSGSVTLTGTLSFTINGTLNNVAAFTTQMDEHDDVQHVYGNYELSDALMEKLSA